VDLLLFWKKSHNMQKTPEAGFCALPGGKGAAVEALPGGEIPLASDAEEPTASERCGAVFSGPTLGIHVVS
tara:strand:+ start:77 stop:289 length:213 start_codon:yes stop_codon:yes gene_type:complete